jgi:hypothetical protein
VPAPQDPPATLTDDEIETRQVLGARPYAGDDTSDSGDDSGDSTDTSDTGDDSGDTSDTADTGDDAA